MSHPADIGLPENEWNTSIHLNENLEINVWE